MDILFERNTEPRDIEALDSERWAATEVADNQFARTARTRPWRGMQPTTAWSSSPAVNGERG